MKRLIIFVLIILNCHTLMASKSKQVEDLFIWKLSDELKLTVAEEKKFAEVIRKINKAKSEMTIEMTALTEKMKNTNQGAKDQALLLKKYKLQLSKYSKLTVEEIDKVQAILGIERTTKYIFLRADFTERLKQLLSTGENPPTQSKASPTDGAATAKAK